MKPNGPDSTIIQTFSGLYVDPLALDVNDVRLEDVAHHLAMKCRWGGAVSEPYSVAQHSLMVAATVAEWGCGSRTRLWALLHDAAETYFVDMPGPLKHNTPWGREYAAVEARAQGVILAAFGLTGPAPSAIKRADAVMLATERRDLKTDDGVEWHDMAEPRAERIHGWPWRDARAMFAYMAETLLREIASEKLTNQEGTT